MELGLLSARPILMQGSKLVWCLVNRIRSFVLGLNRMVEVSTMAFDETLAERMRGALGKRKGLTEKKMFGGIGFMLNGNMCCGVLKSDMLLRLAPDVAEKALTEPN